MSGPKKKLAMPTSEDCRTFKCTFKVVLKHYYAVGPAVVFLTLSTPVFKQFHAHRRWPDLPTALSGHKKKWKLQLFNF
jgi:hypothetical protein